MAAARGKGKGGIQVLRIETKARIGSGLVAHISPSLTFLAVIDRDEA